MRRRKYLAALGSAAAGGAAMMGTSAFETSASERTVSVNVASDSQGFVEITALDSRYASGTESGALELDFDDDSGLGIFDGDAQGLNPNSTFNFDEVFQVANISGTGDMRVVVEASGFSNLDDIALTADGSNAISISEGTSLLVGDYDDVDSLPKLVQPDAVNVDITMETGSNTASAEGTLTIRTATGGNRDELAEFL
jgi:hypothetical protein